MTFDQWLYQDEGFGPRIDRMMDDIKVSVEQERTDDIIKWLMAAYAMGHEEGYDAGYSDAEDIYEDLRRSDDF
jgi:flagellar biosynthesis/type III secretory pathway protein FliH